ncbi:MAG: glucans biosynthesis glucosyltransferase MdoH [Hyphomicrobiaceae bacterium]
MSNTFSPTIDLDGRPDASAAVLRVSTARRRELSKLGVRRLIVATLNIATYAALLAAVAYVLSHGGFSVLDGAILAALAIGAPWTVLGFWNAIIGFILLHGTRDPIAAVAPFARAARNEAAPRGKTAILMTLRNEDPRRALHRLSIVERSLAETGHGAAFSFFVLSDTDNREIALIEEQIVASWKASVDPATAERIIYRRRGSNEGYKAGNVRDFCERWGADYEYMLPLDADSLMAGEAILRCVRIMDANRRIGILQTLVVGLPSQSAFARVFQFGMRAGMRAYTMGQAWWTGDCGPFWGHNAVVRIRPFRRHCKLPVLPGKPPFGGPILSHDQVEATLMRRAGYDVRVLPIEDGSWEENPPTIVDFMQRDTRWCQGNLQYVKLVGLPGLKPLSRFQLVWAILMFLGLPAWTFLIGALPFAALEARAIEDFPTELAAALYTTFLLMYLSPKIAGLLDVALTRGGVGRYGGVVRFWASAAIELVFSFLQGAISTIRTTIFMIGLVFGVRVQWSGQSRDAHGVSVVAAIAQTWPQMLFGLYVFGFLYAISPETLVWSLPLTAGYLLAVPFTCLTASPAVGRAFQRLGLCGIPEDFDPPVEVRALSHGR